MKVNTAWSRVLPARWVAGAATLGPLGYLGRAPGTNGSLAGLVWFTLFFCPFGIAGQMVLLGLTVYLAIGLCGEAERRLYKNDPREVVLDEFVAVPLCFFGIRPYLAAGVPLWVFIFAGFALFRLFDIAKPFGIKKLQEKPGGAGVVLDDLAAAAAACLCLHLFYWLVLVRFFPW